MAYIEFWKRWKDFSGKTSPGDYWAALFLHLLYTFFLFCLLIVIFILQVTVFDLEPEDAHRYFEISYSIYTYICVTPYLSMTVRRLRDAGYNRKNFWKLLLPGVGLIALFTRHVVNNTEESNHK